MYSDTIPKLVFGDYAVVIYWLNLSICLIMGITNIITKTRTTSNLISLYIQTYCYNFTFNYFGLTIFGRSENSYQTNFITDTTQQDLPTIYFLYPMIYVTLQFALLEFQRRYGTRCLLPNKWRGLAYNYQRVIAQDFEIHKLPQEQWPECDFCMSQLHLPSPIGGDNVIVSYHS